MLGVMRHPHGRGTESRSGPASKQASQNANRDRGASHDASPPTPPDVRVRIRRFAGLCSPLIGDGRQAEGPERDDWQSNGKGGAVADPPRAAWAASGLRRQVPADAAASQFSEASTPPLPLLPDDGAQPPPGPFIKCAQYRRSLTETEVAAPSA